MIQCQDVLTYRQAYMYIHSRLKQVFRSDKTALSVVRLYTGQTLTGPEKYYTGDIRSGEL